MFPKKYEWVKIAGSPWEIPFSGDNLAGIEVNGKNICIGKKGNDIFACAAFCPHAGGILAKGHIDSFNNIVCPVHKYRFNMKTGYNSSNEGYFLKTYLVEKRPDGLYVRLEAEEQ